jgi:hypothetical protein
MHNTVRAITKHEPRVRNPKRGTYFNRKRKLALTSLKTWIRFIDDINAAFATN